MIEFHAFENQRAQTQALAQAVGDALQAALDFRGGHARATLAVSGGTSPRAFFQALSQYPIDWARIDITLADERWVAAEHQDSNARLVREGLLQDAARHAYFLPLVDITREPAEQLAALNGDVGRELPCVAVLGMGEDGHTASLFADAPEWEAATCTAKRFVLVHPQYAPYARVSLSLSALKQIDRLFLLIMGQRKREVLNAASEQLQHNAISRLANDVGVKIDAYWCA